MSTTIAMSRQTQLAPHFIESTNPTPVITPQQRLHLDALTASTADPIIVSPDERKAAAQLSPLCSQYHLSEYNRLKFGPRGAPLGYIPLSVQLPGHVKELKERQTLSALRQAWWPADTPHECGDDLLNVLAVRSIASSVSLDSDPSQVNRDHVSLINPPLPLLQTPVFLPPLTPPASQTLQNELSQAMSSTLPHVPAISAQRLYLPKTSESHPINISLIVPFELLPLISAHLIPASHPNPTMFTLSEHLHLHQLALDANPVPNLSSTEGHSTALPPNGVIAALSSHSLQNGTNAVATTLSQPVRDMNLDRPYAIDIPLPPSPSSSQMIIPGTPTEASLSPDSPFVRVSPHPFRDRPPSPSPTKNTELRSGQVASPSSKFTVTLSLPPPTIIGNLCLSSCPGKKVRLTGPVKGRGAICRDLGRDLQRMKDSGVGCVVCCLDDDELEFLGAPWHEYSQQARQRGLDVLRLPTPEGLAPLSPQALNTQLDFLIRTYTLRGISILVHCRGGVGRAGLVACAWMLKLGLCGWSFASGTVSGGMRRDSIEMVERIVSVVRRRRSVKAVETYEQVRFLVDFVDFIRTMSR